MLGQAYRVANQANSYSLETTGRCGRDVGRDREKAVKTEDQSSLELGQVVVG